MAGDNVCPVCGATFTRPQHVGRHMRSHTGDKPYHCKQCPEKFARSDLLSRHVNKTHGPSEGEDANGKPGLAANKKKGKKPLFTSSATALMNASGQEYKQPFSAQPLHQSGIEQSQYLEGQRLPYNMQAPSHGQHFQQAQAYGFMQNGEGSHSMSTVSPLASSSSTGMHMGAPQNQPNGMMYAVIGDNGMATGFKVDEEEEDEDAWIDMPNDHNGNMSNVNVMQPYFQQHQYNMMMAPHSQMPSQIPLQHLSMSSVPYPQHFNGSFVINNVPSSGNPDPHMPGFSSSYSPATMAIQNINAHNSTSDSPPYAFWSSSSPQSSPMRSGLPTYSQPMQQGASMTTSPPALSSNSPLYSLADPAIPRQKSDSPATAGLNIMRRKGNSPLAPPPGGMMSLGPIPTSYSSVMPAPLIPTGTPIADKVEKIKKRACESCNHSKVKCDFQIPCGKCASRKISCVYPTARKSSRKPNTSTSPLSQSASDIAKPTSVSPAISTIEYQPLVAPVHSNPASVNDTNLAPESARELGNMQFQISFSNPNREGAQTESDTKPEEQKASGDMQGTGRQQSAYVMDEITTQMAFADRPLSTDPMALAQIRQAQEEDDQSTESEYTFDHPSVADSRRSSLATPFVPVDDQQSSNMLPFDNLSLEGASRIAHGAPDAPDVHQWLGKAEMVAPAMASTGTSGSEAHARNQNYMAGSSQTALPATFFWQHSPLEYSDAHIMDSAAPFSDIPLQRPDMLYQARPALVRGRSNSVPPLFTPRAGIDPKQYFPPVAKHVTSGASIEQSLLPHDWTAQIRHMATQLNRNASGTSSLQQVDDTLGDTEQSSPHNIEHSSEGTTKPSNSGISAHSSLNPSRPGPAVIQSSMPAKIAHQLLSGNGSLQTLAPERTASFLESTPSFELDGMRWNSSAPGRKVSGTLQSPFKMPNHLARPGNKRLPSQTLGPDMQKRQSISLTEEDMSGQFSLMYASANHVPVLFAPQPAMHSAQLSGRRASMPSWLPDTASGNEGLMPFSNIHLSASAAPNQLSVTGRSATNQSPIVPPSFYPDLTPTLFDPLQQGFNFHAAIDLTTPTVERVAFNTQVDDGKPGGGWPIQA